jgi:hypothetical protein
VTLLLAWFVAGRPDGIERQLLMLIRERIRWCRAWL